MLRPTGARSPYIIMAVNCVWVAVAAFIALKAQFRYVRFFKKLRDAVACLLP